MKNNLFSKIIALVLTGTMIFTSQILPTYSNMNIEDTDIIVDENDDIINNNFDAENNNTEPEHHFVYKDNGDGNHTVTCDDAVWNEELQAYESCSMTPIVEPHTLENGECIYCGFTPSVTFLCPFVEQKLSVVCDEKTFTATGMMPENAELVVSCVDIQSAQDIINNDVNHKNKYTIVQSAYDIKIMVGDEEYQPVEYGENISITITNIEPDANLIVENNEIERFIINHITDDNVVEDIPLSEVNGNIVMFDADSFSSYTIGTTTYNNVISTWNVGYSTDTDVIAILWEPDPDNNPNEYTLSLASSKTGTVQMQDFTETTVPWKDVRSQIVTIQDDCSALTNIGNYAFYDLKNATTCNIFRNRIDKVGDYTFYGCSKLQGIEDVCRTASYIGEYAFYNCSTDTLTQYLHLSTNLTHVGGYAFSGNVHIASYEGTISDFRLNYIGDYAFSGNTNLTYTLLFDYISKDATYVGTGIYHGCSKIRDIVWSDNVQTQYPIIPAQTFYNCSGLESVTIPDYITAIGDSAFANCSSLTAINGGSSVTNLPTAGTNGAFYVSSYVPTTSDGNMSTALKNYDWTADNRAIVCIIGLNTPQITNITKTGSDVNVQWSWTDDSGVGVEYDIDLATDSNFDTAVNTITADSNKLFSNIETEKIYWVRVRARSTTGPDYIYSYYDERIFTVSADGTIHLLSAVWNIGYKNGTVSAAYDDALYNDNIQAGLCETGESQYTLICVGSGRMADWSEVKYVPWNSYTSNITAVHLAVGINNIGACAFEALPITSIDLPSSLGNMTGVNPFGQRCFSSSSLESISLLGFDKLAPLMLANCQSLTSVKFDENLTTIPWCICANCRNLPSIDIPASVTTIQYDAFEACPALTSITGGEGITTMPNPGFDTGAFYVYTDEPISTTIGSEASDVLYDNYVWATDNRNVPITYSYVVSLPDNLTATYDQINKTFSTNFTANLAFTNSRASTHQVAVTVPDDFNITNQNDNTKQYGLVLDSNDDKKVMLGTQNTTADNDTASFDFHYKSNEVLAPAIGDYSGNCTVVISAE